MKSDTLVDDLPMITWTYRHLPGGQEERDYVWKGRPDGMILIRGCLVDFGEYNPRTGIFRIGPFVLRRLPGEEAIFATHGGYYYVCTDAGIRQYLRYAIPALVAFHGRRFLQRLLITAHVWRLADCPQYAPLSWRDLRIVKAARKLWRQREE